MLYNALIKLNIESKHQARHDSIPTLKFDYSIIIEGQLYYVEFDGEQHHIL